MSMGSFMPMPAPLMGGGGGGLDGMITVGLSDFGGVVYYGWSNGSLIPSFGALSGSASPYFTLLFTWSHIEGMGFAFLDQEHTGASLTFQGETYPIIEGPLGEPGTWGFLFGPEVASWPTSGAHPFTLTLP